MKRSSENLERQANPYYKPSSFNLLSILAVFYTCSIHLLLKICSTCRSRSPSITVTNEINFKEEAGICIVTGANTGIGYQTCKELCRRGFTVILACRSKFKGEEA